MTRVGRLITAVRAEPDRSTSPAPSAAAATTVRAGPPAAPRPVVDAGGHPSVPAPAGSAFRSASSSPGSSLPDEVRGRFETAFGTDLSGVRVHTEESGDRLARDRQAAAVTVGGDVHLRAGGLRPGTPEGDRLLAHELTHVVQQGGATAVRPAAGGPGGAASHPSDPAEQQAARVAQVFAAGGRLEADVRGRRAAPARSTGGPSAGRLAEQHDDGDDAADDPTRAVIDEAVEDLGPLVNFAMYLGLGDDPTLFDLVHTAVDDSLADRDPVAVGRAHHVIDEIADIQQGVALPPPQGTVDCTLPGVLRRLRDLHAAASGAGGWDSSAGVRHAVRTVAEHITRAAASALPDDQVHVPEAIARLWNDLDVIGSTLRDGTALLRLELEGVIAELIQERHDFAAADTEDERQQRGARIGSLARQALLLNERLTSGAPAGTPTALDTMVSDRAAEIDRLRHAAADEEGTRTALGDGVTLLGGQQVSVSGEPLGEPADAETTIEPGEAFPIATDTAERRMAGDLGDRIRAQRDELARLRAQVLPANPTYSLTEFAAVHRRWFGLYSLAQEQTDPIVQLALDLMGEPYRLMGADVGSAAIAVEGGVARTALMRLSVDIMTGSMGGGDTDQFADQITAARLRRSTAVTGTAGSLHYRFGEIYTGAGRFEPTREGEVASRTALSTSRSTDTAGAATTLAALPAPLRVSQARQLGLVTGDGDVPLVGIRAVDAREGWTYLTDVYDPLGETVVAREQKTVSPEVVAFLLAARQQATTLAATHVPRSGRTPLGSAPTRGGGVEAATATAQERYGHGSLRPRPPGEVRALAGQLGAARTEAGVQPGRRPPGPEDLIGALRSDLAAYLDRCFVEHQDSPWLLAAIFTVANTEHGVGAQLMALLEPGTLAAMIAEAVKVTAVMSTLQALGPLGALAARAYGGYLASQGVSNVAALISVAGFCHQASDADSLLRARAWGYMARNVADDAGELFSNLVMTAATTGLHTMVEAGRRPTSARELADALAPLMADPATRQTLLTEVNSQIAERESHSANRSDPELESLRGFRDSLEGRTSIDSSAGAEAPLAGRRDEAIDRAAELTQTRPRTAAETAALRSAMPADLTAVPIVESGQAGNAVRVRYGDEGGLRVEVGRDAAPEHVRRHVETVRELRRYEGVLGRVRQLLSRAWQALTGIPGYGTAGFEARLEVRKLNTILGELYARQVSIDARAERLMTATAPDLARERAAVERDIAGIERQLDVFQRNLDSYAAGRGFVAAESTLRAGGGTSGLPLRDSAAMARADQRLRSVEAMLARHPALHGRFAGVVRSLRVDYSHQRDAFLDLSPDSSARSGGMAALSASERAIEIERLASGLLGTLETEAARPAGAARRPFDAAAFYASIRTGLSAGERVARVEMVAGEVADANRMVYDQTLSSLNNRSVYRSTNGELYAVDTQHGSLERCEASGRHLGEVRFDFTHLDDRDATGGHDLLVP